MMKKYIFTLILLASSLMASEIKWAKDFEAGIKQAQAQNKPVFFVFSRHTCHYCVVLEKNAFQNKEVIETLNENFISIISYTDENDYTPRELWRPGTPTMWFLESNGKAMFQPVVGAIGGDKLLFGLKTVKEEFDKNNRK